MEIVHLPVIHIPTLSLFSKHVANLFSAGDTDRREVAGNRFDRLGDQFLFVQDQHGADMNPPKNAGAQIDLAYELTAHFGRVLLEGGIGAIQGDIGDHAEEDASSRPDHGITAYCQVFQGLVAVQTHFQSLAQGAGNDLA